jgi:hypothetical protein
VSQNLSSDSSSEVRISDYAERVVRNWYVVVITVAAAVLLVVLHTVGTGKQSQGQATVYLGTPLTPVGGGTISNTPLTNPTSAQAYLRTASVLDKAAQAAGIKSGPALRKHLSVTVLQNSATKTTGGAPNVQITVQGPWSRQASVAAVSSLGTSLVTWANRYQQAKVDMLTRQIATDQATITSLQSVLKQAQAQLRAIGRSSASSTDKATLTGSLLATISDTGDRIDQISYQMTQNQLFQASAKDVESAGFVQSPSGGRVSASNRKSSLIVAVFAGLIVGVILALLWDAFRRRGRRGDATA